MWKRRDFLKALAALPFVGKLVKEKKTKSDIFREVYGPGGDAYNNDRPMPPALPAVCPLCEMPWNVDRMIAGDDGMEDCLHRWGRTVGVYYGGYIVQLRRRRGMEAYRLASTADAVEHEVRNGRLWGESYISTLKRRKIDDIDTVLRFLGEKP